jgi:putative redox protein
LELRWDGEERFRGAIGGVELCLDGTSQAGPSPMQAVGFGLASCMAIDVVDILRKGRLDVQEMTVRLDSRRAEEPPRRFLSIDLHIEITGAVPADRVERALRLSRETYCSAWHSLRPDIVLQTSFAVRSPEPERGG